MKKIVAVFGVVVILLSYFVLPVFAVDPSIPSDLSGFQLVNISATYPEISSFTYDGVSYPALSFVDGGNVLLYGPASNLVAGVKYYISGRVLSSLASDAFKVRFSVGSVSSDSDIGYSGYLTISQGWHSFSYSFAVPDSYGDLYFIIDVTGTSNTSGVLVFDDLTIESADSAVSDSLNSIQSDLSTLESDLQSLRQLILDTVGDSSVSGDTVLDFLASLDSDSSDLLSKITALYNEIESVKLLPAVQQAGIPNYFVGVAQSLYEIYSLLYSLNNQVNNIWSQLNTTNGYLSTILNFVQNYISPDLRGFRQDFNDWRLAYSIWLDAHASIIEDSLSSIDSHLIDIYNLLNNPSETTRPAESAVSNVISDYVAAEQSLLKPFDNDLNQVFDSGNAVWSGNSAFAFISSCLQVTVLQHPKMLACVLFSLSFGLVVLLLGRRLSRS